MIGELVRCLAAHDLSVAAIAATIPALGFDNEGLPMFRVPCTTFEEVESLDIPDYGGCLVAVYAWQ